MPAGYRLFRESPGLTRSRTLPIACERDDMWEFRGKCPVMPVATARLTAMRALTEPEMSEYQYYEFLAVDRPLTDAELAALSQLSSCAEITATSFTGEDREGNFKGDPGMLMRCYYDAHLHVSNWGTHRIMLRLPRTLLSPNIAGQYCVDGHVIMSTTSDFVILDLTSEDESGGVPDGLAGSLSAIAAVRSELAAGDMRPLYLAWLSGYGAWERDEDAFDDDDEDEVEPPVPAGLGSLTAPQRALADFLRLDPDLLEVAAQASPPLEAEHDAPALAARIAKLPAGEKDRLLMLVAQDRAAKARMELLRNVGADPSESLDSAAPRTVAELLDAAAELRAEREQP